MTEDTFIDEPLPLFFNPGSGSSQESLRSIEDDARIKMEPTSPKKMKQAIENALGNGCRRILVSGGDGTIALAAAAVARQKAELGIIPSGTLNHFAQRNSIPVESKAALEVALHAKARPIEVGYVNEQIFINTSSVGAYPVFVRNRNQLENRMPYLPASLMAGMERLFNFRRVSIALQGKTMRTPLVFIGVNERDLLVPKIGQQKDGGKAGLHLIAVNCKNIFEIGSLVVTSLFFGIDPLQKSRHIENELVDEVELNFMRPNRYVLVACDGEILRMRAPLKYRFAPQEILVAVPDADIE